MTYEVKIVRGAQKELGQLPRESYERIVDSIRALANGPRPTGCTKLVGREGWRIRVGDYRVIYEIEEDAKAVLIVHIGHRRDVYR